MVDRLDRLGHDAVVGRDDQHDDVGHLGAAGPHLGERGVAGRVDERDQLAVVRGLVGTDVLGDAAGFARHDVGVADLVEQRGLAVVDVAHDGDDRRARLLALLVDVVVVVEHRLELELLLLAGLDQEDVSAELEREQLHLLVGQRHGRRDHLAVLQQEAHDVGRGPVQLRRELLGRDALLDDDRAVGHRGIGRGVARHELRLQLLGVPAATTLRLARGAALPTRARAATAGTATGTTAARTARTAGETATGATGTRAATRTTGIATGTRAGGETTRTAGTRAATRTTGIATGAGAARTAGAGA